MLGIGALMSNPERPNVPPTVSIYQNPDYVIGILQQASNLGVLQFQEEKDDKSLNEKNTGGGSVDAGIGVELNLPGVLKGKGDLNTKGEGAKGWDDLKALSITRRYEFTQAYYLHHVRHMLNSQGQLTVDPKSASDVRTGDFIEFSATFAPHEVSALLDVFTPDLASQIARTVFLSGAAKQYPQFYEGESLEEGQSRAAMFEREALYQATVYQEVASHVTRAVQLDFRSEATREFYGQISGAGDLCAVVVCEAEHFVTQDHDRLLDGQFRVLGKVISEPAEDVPVLQRNKILKRINPELVDRGLAWLSEQAQDLAQQIPAKAGAGENEDEFTEGDVGESGTEEVPPVNLDLKARIPGRSFRVIPVAIFA